MTNIYPKYTIGDILKTKDRRGKVVEITLFRRDNTIGYALQTYSGTVFYAPEEDIEGKV